MRVYHKASLSLSLMMGASCVMAAGIGVHDRQGTDPLSLSPATVSVASADRFTEAWGMEPARYWLTSAATDFADAGSATATRTVTARVPTPGSLVLFATAVIGAGVIARKKRREQKHEAVGS